MNIVTLLLAPFKWFWSKRGFIAITLISGLIFFAARFPFSDLSVAATGMIANATNNAVYAQFKTLDISLFPSPALSGTDVTIETATFREFEAGYFKIGPSWLNLIGNVFTIKKAAGGDPEAAAELVNKISISARAEKVLGGDIALDYGAGTKTEQSPQRRLIELQVENINLQEVQKWADLSFKLNGTADLTTEIQFTPGMTEQPDGEFTLSIKKFSMPASTLQVPYEGAVMPVNLPQVTLENVELKGRLSNGEFTIEDGRFGTSRDPLSGRMKGKIGLTINSVGGQMVPMLRDYNISVDLNTTKAFQTSLALVFMFLDNVKTPTSTGSKYFFRAQGTPGLPPKITRISTL